MNTIDSDFGPTNERGTNQSYDDRRESRREYRSDRFARRCAGRGDSAWTPFNIMLMVLGFIFFAPLGFLVLFGLIIGVPPLSLPAKIAEWFNEARGQFQQAQPSRAAGRSGNRIFDEYQQTQLDRIDEIREEVRGRDKQFKEFRTEEVRAKDKKQFDRFMGRDMDDEA